MNSSNFGVFLLDLMILKDSGGFVVRAGFFCENITTFSRRRVKYAGSLRIA